LKANTISKISTRIIVFLLLGICLVGCNEEIDTITLGMTAVKELRYEEAIELFSKELEKTNEEALAYRGQGLAYMGLSNYSEAIISFEQALASEIDSIEEIDYDINYYLATSLYRMGDFKGAIERYSSIIDLNKDEVEAYYLRGTVRLAEGLNEDAYRDFDKVIEIAPSNYNMLIDIYTSLANNDQEEKGISYLQAVIGQVNSSISNQEKGTIYYYLGEYESARDFLALGLEDGGEETVLMLGKSYEALEEYNSATTVYKTYLNTLEVDLKSAAVYNQLALSEKELGNYNDALIALEAAIALENDEMKQTLKYNEIVIYEYLEDYKRATVLMEEYLRLYPDDEVAIREYEFLKTR